MNIIEIISSERKLFETTRYCFSNNKGLYFIENLKLLYKNSKLLNENQFNNLLLLDSKLELIKGYSKIVQHKDYIQYKENRLKYQKLEEERKIERKKEKRQEKELILETKKKNRERILLKREKNKGITEKPIKKEKKIHNKNKNHRELLSYIYHNKIIPSFKGFDKSQLNEIFKRLEFKNELNQEQYLRYKNVQLLFSDINIKNLDEINNQVKRKNKILTKKFSPGTYIIYHKNGK